VALKENLQPSSKWTIFEDVISSGSFSMMGIYVALKELIRLSLGERTLIIERALSEITPTKYGRFRFGAAELYQELPSLVVKFETIGRAEKNLMSKLSTLFDRMEVEIADMPDFKG
jgi:hypothetical protein